MGARSREAEAAKATGGIENAGTTAGRTESLRMGLIASLQQQEKILRVHLVPHLPVGHQPRVVIHHMDIHIHHLGVIGHLQQWTCMVARFTTLRLAGRTTQA